MEKNKKYMDGFELTVQNVYEKEIYRNYLNEKWMKNLVKKLKAAKV